VESRLDTDRRFTLVLRYMRIPLRGHQAHPRDAHEPCQLSQRSTCIANEVQQEKPQGVGAFPHFLRKMIACYYCVALDISGTQVV
jgi:hypothetical protein